MARTGRELNRFAGLFTTEVGPNAPQSTAEDMINVDLQFDSIRGRAPSERLFTEFAPQHGLYFDGKYRFARVNFSTTDFALDRSEFVIDVYFGNLDMSSLLEADTGTAWTIAASGGSSTTLQTLAFGWAIYLTKSSTTIDLRFAWHDGTALREVDLPGVDAEWGGQTTSFMARWVLDSGTHTFALYVDGAAGATLSTAAVFLQPQQGANHTLSVGCFSVGGSSPTRFSDVFLGTIGSIYIYDLNVLVASPWTTLNEAVPPTNLAFAMNPDEGEGTSVSLFGKPTWTQNNAGTVALHPEPVRNNAGQIVFDGLTHMQLDVSNLALNGTRGTTFIFGFTPFETLTAGENRPIFQTLDGDLVCNVIPGTTPATQVRLAFTFAIVEEVSGTTFVIAVTTGDLTVNTNYRVAATFDTEFGTVTEDTTLQVFLNSGAGYVSQGTSSNPGAPTSTLFLILGSTANKNRYYRFGLDDFRLLTNLPRLANAAAANAIDSFTTLFPVELSVSLDASIPSTVTKTGTRVVEWRDNVNQNYAAVTRPQGAPNAWGALQNRTGGRKPKIHGVVPSSEHRGSLPVNIQNLIQQGGAFRYNLTNQTSEFVQHPNFIGVPRSGARGAEFLDRVLIFGDGFEAFKLYPGGAGVVGLPRPFVDVTLVPNSNAPSGDLTPATEYRYQFTAYNSRTGLESQPYQGIFPVTLGVGDDQVQITITELEVQGTDDWDTVRVYREEQGVPGIFKFEQQVPVSRYRPPLGADIVIDSRLDENLLALNELIDLDEFQVPNFSAGAVVDGRFHFGGAGDHPGWLYHSNVNEFETYNPLSGVRRLDDDDGNRLMAVHPLLGRLVILKSRNQWVVNDSYARTGEEPRLVNQGRGCVSPAASVVAANSVFLLSPDRTIYLTDGAEMRDVSSARIKQTLNGFTDEQLARCQAAHEGQAKRVWFKIDDTVLVYSYDDQRWEKYEIPADSIGTGHSQGEGDGEHAVIGFRGLAYRLNYNRSENEESDAGSGNTIWVRSLATGLTQQIGDDVYVVTTWADGDIEGMPIIIVAHETARQSDPSLPNYYEPLFDDTLTRHYTYCSRVGTVGAVEIGIPVPVTTALMTAYAGIQYRRYLSQRISPQGEGSQYTFFDTSLEQGKIVRSTDSAVARFRFDDRTPWDYVRELAGERRDQSFSTRRRARAMQFLVEQFERSARLEVQNVQPRYMVRAPRRKK